MRLLRAFFRIPEFVELGHPQLVLGAANDQVGIRINSDGFEVAISQEAALSTKDYHLLAAAYDGLGKWRQQQAGREHWHAYGGGDILLEIGKEITFCGNGAASVSFQPLCGCNDRRAKWCCVLVPNQGFVADVRGDLVLDRKGKRAWVSHVAGEARIGVFQKHDAKAIP